MEIDPVDGVTSAASGSGPSATSATAARRRTPGRWRRIPRVVIDPSGKVAMARPPEEPARSEEKVGMARPPEEPARMRSGPSKELRRATLKGAWGKKITAPTCRPERPSSSTGRLQKKTGVDQKFPPPTFSLNVVWDPKNPGTSTRVPVLDQTIPPTFSAKIGADQKITSTLSDERYDLSPSTGLLQERPPTLQLELEVVEEGSREYEESQERRRLDMLQLAKRAEEEAAEGPCDTEEHTEEDKAEFRALKLKHAAMYRYMATSKSVVVYKPPSDTIEEHLNAEEMERQADISGWPVCSQAQHFATLALEWYNSTKKTHKFEIAKVLLSKSFADVDYNTYAHVNFTATPTPHSHSPKRLFFAELMLVPSLLACKDTEPMRVLSVSTIDDCCFGGCHEMVRDIKGPVRKDMDYERCHACSERIKHPRGDQFVAGHNRTRMPYVSTFL